VDIEPFAIANRFYYSIATAPLVKLAAGKIVDPSVSTTLSPLNVTVKGTPGNEVPSPRSTVAVPLKLPRPSHVTAPWLTFPSTVIWRDPKGERPARTVWNTPVAEPPDSINTPVPRSRLSSVTAWNAAPAGKTPWA